MRIVVNNIAHEVDSSLSVEALLSMLSIPTEGIAVAVGTSIVKRDSWSSFVLSEDSKVTIIRATQGG